MKHEVTITYKNGETEAVKMKNLMIEHGNIQIELLEKVQRKDSPHPIDLIYVKCSKVKEIKIR